MKTTPALLRAAAAAAAIALAGTAHAVLLDHGPGDPVLTFPLWYRDLNGLAVQECLSQTPSVNPGAGLKPMCFPRNPDPTGFAGNVGPEIFYNALTSSLAGPGGFSLKYVLALEGTYLPAGKPIHGTETVFARVRVTIATQVPGIYRVTHPFGVEVFTVSAANLGPRAVFFTADVPLGSPLNFDAALQGRIGPFIAWDFVDPGLTLSLTNAAGATETFVGDPNFSHTYQGSPFGTNYVRVDGPPGANISGIGDDFIQTPLGFVVGQQYGLPIPTALTIKRASYTRDPVRNVTGIDVFAVSAPANQMILTATGMPSVAMKGDAAGNYFAHVEIPATTVTPAAVTVTNATSVPVNSASQALTDVLNITSATFDSLTRTLSVNSASSDLSVPAPAMTVDGPLGGPMTAGAYTKVLAAGVLPPRVVSVQSSAGGIDTDDVAILPGLSDAPALTPVAVADVLATNENVAANIDVSANDAIAAPALVAQVIVVAPPLSGTAVPLGINTGVVTYTPAANFFGADSFQYVVVDTTGAISNVATVNVTVAFLAVGPVANGDDFALVNATATAPSSKTVAVLTNDTAAAGTTLDPASVTVVTRPLHGNAVPNAAGGIAYTPVTGYRGADSFTYTVANNAGAPSNAATVSVAVMGGVEVVSIAKASYTTAKSQWSIVGSTNWFGPTLLHTTATCWIGKGIAVGALIGTVPVDTAGKFQLVPGPNTTSPPDASHVFTCQTSNGGSISAAVTVL
jgi:Big-like domain-containing protein